MIKSLVTSAFQTGCLSVASESLIRQLQSIKSFELSELEVLSSLEQALNTGEIEREFKRANNEIISYSMSKQ
ncbi:MAG: hypothetical protein WBG70_25095 [Spirulinaceae cyanobacterium]